MDVFETLAEPTRRRIVELLIEGELSAGEICGEFPISQPAVSRHLRVLREARLVSSRIDGQRRVYRLRPGPLAEMDRWLERMRTFWNARLDDLGELLIEEANEQRRNDEEKR